MPKFGTVHINRFLTDYSQKYQNGDFVNEKLFPVVPVKKESDLYIVYDFANFTLAETKRADGAESTEIDWNFLTDNYFCEQYSQRDIVTDRERDNADKPLTIDIDTLELVTDIVMLRKEYDAAQLATNPDNYAAANTAALSGSSQWDQSGSNPLAQFKQIQQAIWQSSRKFPNLLIMALPTALALAYNSNMIELVKYTHDNLPENLIGGGPLAGLLPKNLFGMEVAIAGGAYNNANPGQSADLTDIWGTNVVAAYVERPPKIKSLSYGKTFRTEKFVRKWRVEERQGDMVEYNDIYDLKLTAPSTGFLLQSAIS